MKYYKPQKLVKTIKEIVLREYQSDGIYVALDKVSYYYEEEMVKVEARYGRSETENFHSFEKDLKFTLRGNENFTYIKGMVDGIIQHSDKEIGSN